MNVIPLYGAAELTNRTGSSGYTTGSPFTLWSNKIPSRHAFDTLDARSSGRSSLTAFSIHSRET